MDADEKYKQRLIHSAWDFIHEIMIFTLEKTYPEYIVNISAYNTIMIKDNAEKYRVVAAIILECLGVDDSIADDRYLIQRSLEELEEIEDKLWSIDTLVDSIDGVKSPNKEHPLMFHTLWEWLLLGMIEEDVSAWADKSGYNSKLGAYRAGVSVEDIIA